MTLTSSPMDDVWLLMPKFSFQQGQLLRGQGSAPSVDDICWHFFCDISLHGCVRSFVRLHACHPTEVNATDSSADLCVYRSILVEGSRLYNISHCSFQFSKAYSPPKLSSMPNKILIFTLHLKRFAKNEIFNQLALFFHSRLLFPFLWFCDLLSISSLALLHSTFRVRTKSKKNDQENTWISRIWRCRLRYVDVLYVGCRAADDSSAWPRGSAIVDRTTIHCTIAQQLLCSPKAWTREGNAFCLNVHEASYEV